MEITKSIYKFINGKRVPTLLPKNCLTCNIIFQPHEAKNKFCSRQCYWKMKVMRKDRVKLTKEGRQRISKAISKRNKLLPSKLKGKKRPNLSGEKHFNWKGGRYIQNGYYFLSKNGQIYAEHRYILSQFLGRDLLPNEIVHHINHNKLDNRIENLLITTRAKHARLHKLKK